VRVTARVSRRRLIQVGLGGSIVLALGGGVLSWATRGYRLLPGEAAIGLGEKELCVARAVVEALLPGGDGFPSGVALGIHQRIDEEAWAADDETRRDLSAALVVLEHAPPLIGVFGRLSTLTALERASALQAMMRHAWDVVAQSALAIRQLCLIFYFCRDETWAPIGYEGPWLPTPRPPDSALRYAELLADRGRPRA
jgi:hypothetical protein